jgi:PAS domain-containing protein
MSRGEASGRRASERAGASASAEAHPLPDLPTIGEGGFDFSSILAVADMLPVMIAYTDVAQRIQFVNKPLAEWFERSRSSILGLTLRELIGEEAYA